MVAAPAQADPVPGNCKIMVAQSGKCLDIRNASAADGAALVRSRCDGRSSQRFTLSTRTGATGQPVIQTYAGNCLALDPGTTRCWR
ncbi:RICIN domain-containing protein [Streptomyces goshikiensis]|uniref:RICIN domain-containing protein n=1 Tax=Streptomyces goshikiensis TaxID=1942 RepID=UPI003917382E